jgi:hypothetical protein
LNRRRFLGALGATALTLPFLRSMPTYAAEEDRRYLILLFTPNGVIRHLWGADPGAAPEEFVLRQWLQPLAKYQDKMIVLRGLTNKGAGVGDPHGPGMASLYTGTSSSGQGWAMSPSIDQLVANELAAPTPRKSLELRATSPQDYYGKSVYNRMIYSLDGQPVDPREDAVSARDELFLGIGGSTTPTEPDPKLEMRKRLLTRLDGELGRLTPSLCTEDRQQLDALRSGWNELQKTLGTTGTGAIVGCEKPSAITGGSSYPEVARDHVELLAMSLACDLTRVASLQFSHALSPMVADWLNISTDHHNLSHMAPHRHELGPNAPQMSDADNPTTSQMQNAAIEPLSKIYQFYVGEILHLCDRLSEFSLGNGKTLLDQCIICWGNELDNGSDHDHWEMPLVLIGGGNGRLKTGQLVSYPVFNGYGKPPDAKFDHPRAHNDLLVTLAQAMGVNVSTFGNTEYNVGLLSEILV